MAISMESTAIQGDYVIRAAHVDYALKNALVNMPSRLVRMQMDEKSISFTVSFREDELFLKRLFCACLSDHQVEYTQEVQSIKIQQPNALFLNKLYNAVEDFRGRISNRVEHTLAAPSAFFSNQFHGTILPPIEIAIPSSN